MKVQNTERGSQLAGQPNPLVLAQTGVSKETKHPAKQCLIFTKFSGVGLGTTRSVHISTQQVAQELGIKHRTQDNPSENLWLLKGMERGYP